MYGQLSCLVETPDEALKLKNDHIEIPKLKTSKLTKFVGNEMIYKTS